jgi:hypothetical protein
MKNKPKYSLTEEHKAQLKPWVDKWIKVTFSTESIKDSERPQIVNYVNELYKAEHLKLPKTVLFVKSPFALCVIGGFALAISQLGKKAKISIEDMAKKVEKEAAKVKSVNDDKWYSEPYSQFVHKLSDRLELGKTGIECIKKTHDMWNGGNQWIGWVSHLTFFRYVANFEKEYGIDYSKWNCYEKLAEMTGPRIVHSDFCIISDKPTVLKIDDRNRAHCNNGPFKQWSDGSSLYSFHGVRIPKYIIETPDKLTVDIIEKEPNAEVRRVMIERYGTEKFILDSKNEIVHADDYGTLYKKSLENDEPIMVVKVVNSTMEPDGSFKDYFIRVDPNAYGGLKTARAAVASTWRKEDGSLLFEKPEDYVCEVET